jgi:transposase
MTLHPTPMSPVPEATARIARAAVPKGTVYVQMRDVLGSISTDEQFADRFAVRGRPVVPPWRLALVTVMPFAEGLSDRQAAEAVRVRIDWKYALGLELADPGFDYSVLSEFRARLVQGAAEQRLLDALVEACKAHGVLKARGRQRTDATHVLGALRVLWRLERVAETLRAALNALAKEAPDWLQERVPADWYERYGRRIEDYRLPRGQAARAAYAQQVGADGGWLLAQLTQPQTPTELNGLAEVGRLRQFWQQEYVVNAAGGYELRDPKAVPAASEHLESPYEPEARFATKRGMHWTGYKVHLKGASDGDLRPGAAPPGDAGEHHHCPGHRRRPAHPYSAGARPAGSAAPRAARRCRLCARAQRRAESAQAPDRPGGTRRYRPPLAGTGRRRVRHRALSDRVGALPGSLSAWPVQDPLV